MVGSYVTIIAKQTNELICKGMIMRSYSDMIDVKRISDIMQMSSDVILLEHSFSKETFVYSGTILSIDEDSVLIADLQLISDVERRSAPRIPLNMNVLVFADSVCEDIISVAADISESGILLTSDITLKYNDKLTIQMPLDLNDGTVIFSAKADIIRSAGFDGEHHYGCHFDYTDYSEKDKLHKFIANKRMEFMQKKIQ